MSEADAVDGSLHRHRDVPHCGGYSRTAKVSLWHDSAGCGPAHERLLLGVELPKDAGSAAIRSGAAASDALPDRRLVTQSGERQDRLAKDRR